MKNKNLMMLSILIFGLISCSKNNGTSTGNPFVSLNMTGGAQPATAAYENKKKSIFEWILNSAYAFSPPPTLLDSTSLSVSLNDFWICISEIELKYDSVAQIGEVNGDSVEYSGPYVVNLFSNAPSALAVGFLPQNSLRRIKYKTTNISDLNSGAPAGMLNKNLYLSGVVNGNNFVFKSSEQLSIETSGPKLVTLNSGDNLLLQIQTAELIRKINLSAVANNMIISESNRVAQMNPCPLIDASSADLYTCFIKGLKTQTKVGKDNGDNVFGASEETIN